MSGDATFFLAFGRGLEQHHGGENSVRAVQGLRSQWKEGKGSPGKGRPFAKNKHEDDNPPNRPPPLETPNTGAARPVLASRLPPKKGDAATAYAEAKRTKRAATDRIFFCRCYILLAGRGVMKGSDLSVAIEKLYHTGLVDAASI